MATDFRPDRHVPFADFIELTNTGIGREMTYPPGQPATGRPSSVMLTLDRINYLHAAPDVADNVVFTRYGRNSVGPILDWLDKTLGVRIGPEHERGEA